MTDTVRYDECMHHAHAGKQYGCAGPNYEDITWNEPDEAKPTQAELDAVWAEIGTDITNKGIDLNRMVAYPSTQELIVALWEKLVETDGLTSDAIAAIQAKRAHVKSDNPKG